MESLDLACRWNGGKGEKRNFVSFQYFNSEAFVDLNEQYCNACFPAIDYHEGISPQLLRTPRITPFDEKIYCCSGG
jgi:hypothetical protein